MVPLSANFVLAVVKRVITELKTILLSKANQVLSFQNPNAHWESSHLQNTSLTLNSGKKKSICKGKYASLKCRSCRSDLQPYSQARSRGSWQGCELGLISTTLLCSFHPLQQEKWSSPALGGSLRTFWGTSGSVSTAPSELLILSLQKKIATTSWVGARLKRRMKREFNITRVWGGMKNVAEV